jgi:hypothetical protein
VLIQHSAIAQLRLILISNDTAELTKLRDDMRASRLSYQFHHISSSADLVEALEPHLASVQTTPVVIVVDYGFTRRECERVLAYAKLSSRNMAIECVVTNPPGDAKIRAKLKRLGATLFDEKISQNVSDSAQSAALTLH